MSKSDIAINGFLENYSCSQMVFSVFASELGLDENTAKKISCGFGGGVSHTGHMCGAVTGAVMVIGLKYGKSEPGDNDSKEKTCMLVQKFIGKFTECHGSVYCKDLIGLDLSNPAELEEAGKTRLTKEICPEYIKSSIEILEEIM